MTGWNVLNGKNIISLNILFYLILVVVEDVNEKRRLYFLE